MSSKVYWTFSALVVQLVVNGFQHERRGFIQRGERQRFPTKGPVFAPQ